MIQISMQIITCYDSKEAASLNYRKFYYVYV